jgi:2,3-bisphosphoglycerate-dependent phosphoglycerate mutase
MQLFFIRHGQSENNALWSRTGSDQGRSEDPALTELGFQQAHYLANYLRDGNPNGGFVDDHGSGMGFGITHIYTSLMIRAVDTGIVIADYLGLPVFGRLDLFENGGIYLADPETGERCPLPGKDRAYFNRHYPSLILPEDLIDLGWWNKRPVETSEQCFIRAQGFVAELLAKHLASEDRVAVISHGGFYNHLLPNILGMDRLSKTWFAINNTAITRIDFVDEWTGLVYQNRTDHLPVDLLT